MTSDNWSMEQSLFVLFSSDIRKQKFRIRACILHTLTDIPIQLLPIALILP